jgi:TonB-dependent SusC/RagA subfamily outer membrane receptor
MPYIAWYLLKLSVSLSVVYLFYILVLRRLTFYNWNRWYLLGYSLLAFFIPFVNISPVLQESEWDKNLLIQLIPAFNDAGAGHEGSLQQPVAWWSYLLIGALTGIVLMMGRFLIRFISYQRIRRSARLMVDVGVKVYHVDKSIIPFSFGNAIFINPQLHAEDDLEQIIHHEFIHVKQKHTIDILWGELLCMLNWYNPFAWLIRKAIRQNLEFIADHKVLENGIDKKDYQYLLLKVTGAAHFSITQQFNFSSLKKRIIMMNRSKSAKIQLTRFLFMLPLLTILLLAFRTNVIQERSRENLVATKLQLQALAMKTLEIIDTVPASGKGDVWKTGFLKKHPSVKKFEIEKGSIIVIFRNDGIQEKYDWNDMNARKLFWKRYSVVDENPEAVELKERETIITDTATAVGTLIDASLTGPGNPNIRLGRATNVLLIVDGVVHEDGTAKLREIEPNSIESIDILKGESATQLYGEKAKGKDGVVIVETKKKPENFIIKGTLLKNTKDSMVFTIDPEVKLKRSGNHDLPDLFIIDGKEFSAEEFKKLNIEPSSIESITILKDAEAMKIYGEKAKKGVIIIALKKPITKLQLSEPWDSEKIKFKLQDSEQVVWIINGNTYVSAGKSFAMQPGIIDHIIVKDRVYTRKEANELFKRSDFSGCGIINAQTLYRVHGIDAPALQLAYGPDDFEKYREPKTTPGKSPKP